MKVLILGLPRTGTQSLADALVQLGISPIYHMREVAKNSHQALWVEAIKAKYERGKSWGREEFGQILAGFEGLADYPAAIFPTELIAAYPDARIILTTRSEKAWFDSMESTLWHLHVTRTQAQLAIPRDPSPKELPPMVVLSNLYHKHCWGNDFPANGEALFHKHNAAVREASKGREFLEYTPGDGWGPLCEFLGVKVPDLAYPRSDDWVEYKKMVDLEKKAKAAAAAATATGSSN